MRDHKKEVWRNKGKKGKKEKRQRKFKSAETNNTSCWAVNNLAGGYASSQQKGKGKGMDISASTQQKGEGVSRHADNKQKGKGQAAAMVELNQWLDFIKKGIEVVLEEMRSGFVLAEETRFTEMEKMLWQYNTMLHGQQPSKPASNLLPPIQPASSTSSLPPALASTLAPIAEAEEPNDDKAAQLKEDESEMDHATAVAITVDQSTIANDSALISDSIAIMTDSSNSSRSATISVDLTRPTASITNSAIATDSIISTGPTAIITNSTIATRPAANNESTVPTSVETILASLIAATGHLMDVDMTGPAPSHPPDEIVP
ncbi:hypothetical protein E4T56_gene20654 [Termitomyces sp. T112]|nr:hypothetical protein E4T56_gene20654 [Termitomyces sp. T112]